MPVMPGYSQSPNRDKFRDGDFELKPTTVKKRFLSPIKSVGQSLGPKVKDNMKYDNVNIRCSEGQLMILICLVQNKKLRIQFYQILYELFHF